MNESKRYLANPDVSCREEGQDGALLFNPDTDGMMVVNPTGLLIWQTLKEPRSPQEIIRHLLDACEGVPTDQVGGDVEEFLEVLLPGGFVGEVMEASAR
jgi:hypothetical protein